MKERKENSRFDTEQSQIDGISIPEGWKVKEEESHSEESSISIEEQVQDWISVSRIFGY